MAVAVLLAAFVIRMLIVPALMHRLGRSNLWLPTWLDKILPHLSIEGPRHGWDGVATSGESAEIRMGSFPDSQ